MREPKPLSVRMFPQSLDALFLLAYKLESSFLHWPQRNTDYIICIIGIYTIFILL